MTVLAADWQRVEKVPGLVSLPLAASTIIYKGSGVMVLLGAGNCIPAADTALGRTVGVAQAKSDNSSGSAGDKILKVESGKIWQFACSGAGQGWVGKLVYWIDDNTVGLLASTTNGILAGKVTKYISSTLVEVLVMVYEGSEVMAEAVDITSLRNADLAMIGITPAAGDHNLVLGTNVISVQGVEANNNTKTDVSWLRYTLPKKYVPGGTITLRVRALVAGAGTSNASTVDFSAYKQADIAVGSDLVETAAQEMTEDTWADHDFVVTPTGLLPGMILNVKFTSITIESATDALITTIEKIQVLCDTYKG